MSLSFSDFVLLLLVLSFFRQYVFTLGSLILSSTGPTRKLVIKSSILLFRFWFYLRSLALVSVVWKNGVSNPSFQQPTIRFLVGHGGGGRKCGSLLVYSPPTAENRTTETPLPPEPVPFSE